MKALKSALLVTLVSLFALCFALAVACGDDDPSVSSGQADDDSEDEYTNDDANDDADVDNDLNDDTQPIDVDDDEADMQSESSFEYLDENFADLFEFGPTDEPRCDCDTPLGDWLCFIEGLSIIPGSGYCQCESDGCCRCYHWWK